MLIVSSLLDPSNPLSLQLSEQFPRVFNDLSIVSQQVDAEIRIIDDLLTICRFVLASHSDHLRLFSF